MTRQSGCRRRTADRRTGGDVSRNTAALQELWKNLHALGDATHILSLLPVPLVDLLVIIKECSRSRIDRIPQDHARPAPRRGGFTGDAVDRPAVRADHHGSPTLAGIAAAGHGDPPRRDTEEST